MNGDQVMFELLVPYQRIGPRFISATYVPDLGKEGRIRGFFSLISDISEIRHTEDDRNRHLKQAAHTARLNSMGELASRIIHEVSQPLAAIVAYSEACSRLLASGHYDLRELVASLDDIGKQAERAGKIIRKIRNFVSKHEARFVETDINGLVRETLRLMELDPNWRATQFHLKTETAELRAQVDPVMIEQVILNLLHNALEAMQDQPSEQRRLTLRTRRNTDGEVEVEVEDEGPGLSTTQFKQLFQPFTSTKPNGMGMGLTISRSIIMQHGGRLWVSTNPEGAPASDSPCHTTMTKQTSQHPKPTVHIVDDDASVRKALSLLVGSAELEAETYASAREFLFRYRPDGPACLVLDIRMPEMDGLELQAVLAENRDPIPIIMVTGQGDIPMAVRAIKQGALDFIEKPFPQGRLLQLVKLALDRDEKEHARHVRCAELERRMASLTRREQDVLGGLVQGKQSKVVAAELGISARTVEAHRAHILYKLGARSVLELVRMMLTLEDGKSEKDHG